MASCRAYNLRVLVAVVCGLLTAVFLGLSSWIITVRIKAEKTDPPPSAPTDFCKNGGAWENGKCICTEEWKGLRCTIPNFCENSTYENLTFGRITVGKYGPSLQTCGENTKNAGNPVATRMCSQSPYGEIQLQTVTIGNCDETLQQLEIQINSTTAFINISKEAQILTYNANKLTAEDITSATKVVGQIFDSPEGAEQDQAKKIAVTTVSQLLDASEDVFQKAAADNNDTFTRLIEQMESYSLTLDNERVLEPNIAIQSVNITSENIEGSTGVLFSVLKGTSSSFASGSTSIERNVSSLNPSEQTELQILLNTTRKNTTACGFVVYQNNKLFQSKRFIAKSNFSQKIISSTTGKKQNQTASVEMVFSPKYNPGEFRLHSYACAYWDILKKDWDTYGCHKVRDTGGFLRCRCNHTTNFAVLMTFQKDVQYPDSLDKLSQVGCALSITGLVLTIIFQIATRKVRKTSVTWVLVSLCTSMLIFNLLFVFGIENSNKNLNTNDSMNADPDNNTIPPEDTVHIPNHSCTVTAAFLHYFLLVTFTWNGLSATQLYFLLIRTMKPLPPHFILFISLIGWGVPALIVSMTVGIIYSQNRNSPSWELRYRQEEICWLAIPEGSFITSPFFWSFLVPVTIILISNVAIFIIITVKVLWKNNQNLTSTKKVSSLKKILSTLSIAVIFGITWILAYIMLANNDVSRNVSSYIFCLFNTTQGFQIFILYTIRTKIFQSEASKVLKSLSSSAGRVKSLPSVTGLRLRVRMYNMLRTFPALSERFRLLEPSVTTEETLIFESDQANSST
ncbi:putative G-protein coupled receptor 128 [Tupaia chinensis]|uniref:Adhesion G-protein coupled receptor G7 n=1 Tax=Tupaia chinensis TaxID=246437 RepID=L9L8E4_TUPCH|nr:putative G-protein coupled receptor 128 [Tupaia chinensis]